MAPDVTSFLQEPDTHEHSQLKSILRQCKIDLQLALELEWKRKRLARPDLKYPNQWGPYECLYIVSEGLAQFKAKFPKVPLDGLQATQMLRVRPTAEGFLEQVTGFEPWSHSIFPSRGISAKLVAERDRIIGEWDDNEPPEPDWSLLDGKCFEADIAPEVRPETEELVLDLAFADLELSERQKTMLIPPEHRIENIVMPASIQTRDKA